MIKVHLPHPFVSSANRYREIVNILREMSIGMWPLPRRSLSEAASNNRCKRFVYVKHIFCIAVIHIGANLKHLKTACFIDTHGKISVNIY